ncbi:methyltransferase type 11 [Sulfolobus sp. A20]|uniref:class I SAM-dependent methyltransferase n=1 Tax=Sulfolobaceae TaxID=118883 RepID=UPI0008461593|nr:MULTISPECIES: class I SAM-dependent methyltransferase [unclassified Sulfolobus]TRM75030.1 class I SAM-dependent methyltransferase [Sulfolobus sp. B5]TRM81119.1 class I SAM-dependent methyltransferase [Sulfolobus sp. D5]TRM86418.1 class I SAM-dependent methyltransferase [Sulfolobus sp. E3]TRM89550.1 class I SAM-dependent methyltransferase [Sulfolobus sp. C3]TRM93686.1 class I SAM-dependent methyltransferase [Sulfolobus sp. A20-N-G8]TRN00374.1 class I SAM-dependent methyltransferase [Sulfolo
MHGHFYPPEEFRRKYERPEEFLPSVITNKGVVIVDYGCGNGFYCKYLVQYASKLYCIDVNVIALEEVKRKISNAITLTDSKTIENKSVDYILFANSFHDMENKEEIINEVNRILKDDGRVIIIDWKKENTNFGPPVSIRMSEKEYLYWFKGFKIVKRFNPTPYHYGLVLERIS